MATRHTGHSFFVSSAVRMQSLQYVWPQGVVNGLVSWSQQMGQRSAASERRALERVIYNCEVLLTYYYLRSISTGESLYSAPKSGLDRLLGCD